MYKELFLNTLIPSLYPLGLFVAWLSPKNFGFGSDNIVYLGFAFGALGLSVWITATLNIGSALRVLPGAKKLVRRGIYRYIRHPIYLGIDMTFLGLFLCLGSTAGLIYLISVVIPLNLIRAKREEKALIKQFGQEYKEYAGRTWF